MGWELATRFVVLAQRRGETRATPVAGRDAVLLPKLSLVSLLAAVRVIRVVWTALAVRNVMVRSGERTEPNS
jgi:hypothetical protein